MSKEKCNNKEFSKECHANNNGECMHVIRCGTGEKQPEFKVDKNSKNYLAGYGNGFYDGEEKAVKDVKNCDQDKFATLHPTEYKLMQDMAIAIEKLDVTMLEKSLRNFKEYINT
jgi:hypothetical protein